MTRLYRTFACSCLFSLLACAVSAQDTSIAFGSERARWFRIAQEVKPALQQTVVEPVGLVRPVRDSTAFQGWRMEPAGDMQQFYDMTYQRESSISAGMSPGISLFRCIQTVGRMPRPVSGLLSARCLPNSPHRSIRIPAG